MAKHMPCQSERGGDPCNTPHSSVPAGVALSIPHYELSVVLLLQSARTPTKSLVDIGMAARYHLRNF